MKFEPQCKTRAEMLREAARVIEMCDGTGICPYYKYKDNEFDIIDTLEACDTPEGCEFPIAIVEGKIVWRGDELYTMNGTKFTACYFDGEHLIGVNICENVKGLPSACKWNPPRKTITINGKELPAPDSLARGNQAFYSLTNFPFSGFGWENKEDRDKVEAAIIEALESRPPKM